MESVQVVHHAIKNGINYIDVAPWYGHGKAETVLGKVCNFYNQSNKQKVQSQQVSFNSSHKAYVMLCIINRVKDHVHEKQ